MGKILIFAGTTEGRLLWEYCNTHKIPVTASVATEYGETILLPSDCSDILMGKLDREDMEEIIRNKQYELVIDATHPYAAFVTENIKEACRNTQIRYIRVLRENIPVSEVIYVDSVKGAADYLNLHTGNALITTGSKELEVFTQVKNYTNRLTVRVLPDYEVVKQCISLGFKGTHLICMQGPFSKEMNWLMLKERTATYLVTKESGAYGGFPQKLEGAKKAGAKVIVIKRPKEEEGVSLQEVMELLGDFYSI